MRVNRDGSFTLADILSVTHVGDIKFLSAVCQSKQTKMTMMNMPSGLLPGLRHPSFFGLEYSIAALYRVLDETGS